MRIKDWKAFQAYRDQQRKHWLASKEYQKILKMYKYLTKQLEPKRLDHRFLWFKWTETIYPSPWECEFLRLKYSHIEYLSQLYQLRPEFYIPDETVEACMNWLLFSPHPKKEEVDVK